MAQEHPNWIEEHAKCHMQSLFTELCNIITIDTDRIMKVPGPKRRLRNYRRNTDSETCCICRTGPNEGDEERLTFTLRENAVQVHQEHSARDWTITTQWDSENTQCRIQLDRGTQGSQEWSHKDLWKVVQTLLDPFFFQP